MILIRYLSVEKINKVSGVPTEAGVVTRWNTDTHPPILEGTELLFSGKTPPMDLAHELGHIKLGHHKGHPRLKTLDELFEEEIEASKFASIKTKRKLRIKDATNACEETLRFVRKKGITKAKIDTLAESACLKLFGVDCPEDKIKAVKDELYYHWKHGGFL